METVGLETNWSKEERMPQINMVCSNTCLTGKPEKLAPTPEGDGSKYRITRKEAEIQLMFLEKKRLNELQAKETMRHKETQLTCRCVCKQKSL